ncbi:putative membrane protein YpjA [Paenibacillus anaericanus]|nr:putative membrane protein YpjA [Paenibacillus anaericanus]
MKLRLSYFWSRAFLSTRFMLWLFFISNLLGTVYGYIWYGGQLRETWMNQPHWLIVFVPDSPTASLFFTLALLFLLFPGPLAKFGKIRTLIEALAVVTSVKYGVWAVSMIFAGAHQGGDLVWQDWMLVASHLAMAVETLLFVRMFKFGTLMILSATCWTLLNDLVDYTYDVYPWLPQTLYDDVNTIKLFTVLLTVASAVVTWIALKGAKRT